MGADSHPIGHLSIVRPILGYEKRQRALVASRTRNVSELDICSRQQHNKGRNLDRKSILHSIVQLETVMEGRHIRASILAYAYWQAVAMSCQVLARSRRVIPSHVLLSSLPTNDPYVNTSFLILQPHMGFILVLLCHLGCPIQGIFYALLPAAMVLW